VKPGDQRAAGLTAPAEEEGAPRHS
jgi:hypothetical protein